MKSNFYKILALTMTTALTTGCAGGVSFAVKEQDKDLTNSYDGAYIATVKHPGGRQSMGNNWTNNCSAQDFTTQIQVAESEVTWRWDKDTLLQGYVDKDGRFRIEEGLGNTAKANTVMSDNSVSVILQGILNDEEMAGRLVYGMGQFNGRGCSYPVSYQPAS